MPKIDIFNNHFNNKETTLRYRLYQLYFTDLSYLANGWTANVFLSGNKTDDHTWKKKNKGEKSHMKLNPRCGDSVLFLLGLWISANSVGNINTAKSLQKNRKKFASRPKMSHSLGPFSCLSYTSTLIHLFAFIYIYYGYLRYISRFGTTPPAK